MKYIKAYNESSKGYETIPFNEAINIIKRRDLRVESFTQKEVDSIQEIFPGKTIKLIRNVFIDVYNEIKISESKYISFMVLKYTDEWYILPTIFTDRWNNVENVYLCDGLEGLLNCLKTY